MPDSDTAPTARNQSVQAVTAGSPALLKGFLDSARNIDVLGGTLVSDQAFQASRNIATGAWAAAVAGIPACQADSHGDLLDVPVLVVDGDADWILPFGFPADPDRIVSLACRQQPCDQLLEFRNASCQVAFEPIATASQLRRDLHV